MILCYLLFLFCYYPLESGSPWKSWKGLLLTSRLLHSSKVRFFCFCFSCMRCFILIAMLCACGSSRYKSPNLLLRNIVFLAMGSCLFLQIYWKILFCILKVVFVSIGKMLLKNDVFESMSVFAIITLPFRKGILGESLFICFSILSIVLCQFMLFAYCKSSLKYISSIFIFSFWSFIVISVGKFVVIFVFIGSTV